MKQKTVQKKKNLKKTKQTKKTMKTMKPNKKNISLKQREKMCVDKYVKYRQQKNREESKKMQEELKKQAKMSPEAKKIYENLMKSQKVDKKMLKVEHDTIKNISCNIGCKGTVLEPGDASKIPQNIINNNTRLFKKNPEILKSSLDLVKETREKIFGNKNNVLEDNFYNKLSKQFKNKQLKLGAISHCGIY